MTPYCAECGEPQFSTPAGITCLNGHDGAKSVTRNNCTCVYATAENTPAVREGYEVGGYLTHECDACKAEDAAAEKAEQDEFNNRVATLWDESLSIAVSAFYGQQSTVAPEVAAPRIFARKLLEISW